MGSVHVCMQVLAHTCACDRQYSSSAIPYALSPILFYFISFLAEFLISPQLQEVPITHLSLPAQGWDYKCANE